MLFDGGMTGDGITTASILSAAGRAMLGAASSAAQTALLDIATSVKKGLMSAAQKVKVDYQFDLLDDVQLLNQTTYTSAAWTADKYQRIELEFNGQQSAASYVHWQANAATSLVYSNRVSLDWSANSIVYVTHPIGANAFSYVGYAGGQDVFFKVSFNPKSGINRIGRTEGTFSLGPDANQVFGWTGAFGWYDTATAVTFATLSVVGGAKWTGRMTAKGYY